MLGEDPTLADLVVPEGALEGEANFGRLDAAARAAQVDGVHDHVQLVLDHQDPVENDVLRDDPVDFGHLVNLNAYGTGNKTVMIRRRKQLDIVRTYSRPIFDGISHVESDSFICGVVVAEDEIALGAGRCQLAVDIRQGNTGNRSGIRKNNRR